MIKDVSCYSHPPTFLYKAPYRNTYAGLYALHASFISLAKLANGIFEGAFENQVPICPASYRVTRTDFSRSILYLDDWYIMSGGIKARTTNVQDDTLIAFAAHVPRYFSEVRP